MILFNFSDSIILGEDKNIIVIVSAENVGEPGYQCELHIQGSKEIKLDKTCIMENTTYICLFANKLDSEKTVWHKVVYVKITYRTIE